MDTGRRSSVRQPAARAPFLPAANHAPLRASVVQRPSCWPRLTSILVKNKRTTTRQACIHLIPIFHSVIKNR
jgi:hypothetical protein